MPERASSRETGAIHLRTKYMRGIVGGFEQGAGIAGGVQLTSADAIPGFGAPNHRPDIEPVLSTFRRSKRYLPNIRGSRNHADVWFSYMRRESDFFGIGPRISEDLKTNFAIEQRSYQGSLYRDLADHFQGGVYAGLTNSHSSGGKANTTHRSARAFRARRISRSRNGFPVSFRTQRSCRTAASSYTTLVTTLSV